MLSPQLRNTLLTTTDAGRPIRDTFSQRYNRWLDLNHRHRLLTKQIDGDLQSPDLPKLMAEVKSIEGDPDFSSSSLIWGRAGKHISGPALTDTGYLPAVVEMAVESITSPSQFGSTAGFVAPVRRTRPQGRRERTGNPVVDGLVGVEPNPGPTYKTPKVRRNALNRTGGKKRRPGLSGGQTLMGSNFAPMVSGPIGLSSTTPKFKFSNLGTRTLFGIPAHIFSGSCAIQNVVYDAGGICRFSDANTNIANECYLNPRICCQNAAYNVPAGYCPIGVVSQAYRKFQFTKVRYHYLPVNSQSTDVSTVAFAFEPSYIATTTLGANVMAYANFECSMYGPAWQPLTLDVTKFLDKSRWFSGEINSAAVANAFTMAVQGTLQCAKLTSTRVNNQVGIICLEFELAMYELGPTEVSTQPALLAPASRPMPSASSAASDAPGPSHPPSSDGEFVYVSKNVLKSVGL